VNRKYKYRISIKRGPCKIISNHKMNPRIYIESLNSNLTTKRYIVIIKKNKDDSFDDERIDHTFFDVCLIRQNPFTFKINTYFRAFFYVCGMKKTRPFAYFKWITHIHLMCSDSDIIYA